MMSETMMALGAFRFSLDTAAYQDFKRSQTYRWQSQERLLRRPALQFLGLGEETIELNGLIYPHFRGGLTQVETMRVEANKGSRLVLVDGLGFVWGSGSSNRSAKAKRFSSQTGNHSSRRFN